MDLLAPYITLVLGGIDVYGVMGLVLSVLASQMPRRQWILGCGMAAALCFSIHYDALGSTTGALLCLLAASQSALAAIFVKEEGPPRWLGVLFCACLVPVLGGTLLSWSGPSSLAACLGAVLSTVARIQSREEAMRGFFLGSCLSWAIHDGILMTLTAFVCEAAAAAGYALALARHRTGRNLSSVPA